MNQNRHLPQEITKIIERLFVFVDSKDIEMNRKLFLVVNPQILKILFTHLKSQSRELKIDLIRQLSYIYSKNNLNSAILSKRDKQIIEYNYCILDDMIDFLFEIKPNHSQINQFIDLLQPFIIHYPITSRNIKNITKKIAYDFYWEKFNHERLHLSLKILKNILESQITIKNEPQSYFIVYGENSGFRMIDEHAKWSFVKELNIYIWFNISNSSPNTIMNLLEITIRGDTFHILIDQLKILKIKVFSIERKFPLIQLLTNKWHLLHVNYSLKKGVFRNTYEVTCKVDDETIKLEDLPVPDIGMRDQIEQLIMGRDFYGFINTAIISRQPLQNLPNYGIGNWKNMENFLIINRKSLRNIFLLYLPLITTKFNHKEILFDVATRNHAEIGQNTGIYINPFKSVDIGYYGGLYTLLPFFHMLKFYKYQLYPHALQHSLEVILVLFQNQFKGIQQQALVCQFFSILGFFLNQIDCRFITIDALKILKKLRKTLTLESLQKQFLIHFLWKIKTKHIQSTQVVDQLFNMIIEEYNQNVELSLNSFGLESILRYVIDNFQPSNSSHCCLHHWYQLSNPNHNYQEVTTIIQHYKTKGKNIQRLLRFILSVNINYDRTILIKFLLRKYSICFTKIVLRALGEGIQAQPQIYINDLNIIVFIIYLLKQAELNDQLTPIIHILALCIKHVDLSKRNHILWQIHQHLNTIYLKKYSQIKVRSKSEKIQQFRGRNYGFNRKYSLEKQNNQQTNNNIKQQLLKLKSSKSTNIENNQQLFIQIVGICFSGDELVLNDDEFILVVQPYFKLCCTKFRVKIIQFIRNTVLVGGRNFSQLTRLYKFMLTQFVQKQLDPQISQYLPCQQTNYIIKNMYFIVDHVVITLKNDWDNLYYYIVLLTALLEQAKQELVTRTSRTYQEVLTNTKLCVRKFVLRIIKYAQEQLENFPNLLFLTYIVVFNNIRSEQNSNMFEYFSTFEDYLFIAKYNLLDNTNHYQTNNNIFVDYKLILDTISTLRLQSYELCDTNIKVMNRIKAYLNSDFEIISKLRKIFLTKTNFKQLYGQNKVMFNFFNDKQQDKDVNSNVTVGQLISLLLRLCIEFAFRCKQMNVLKLSLIKLEQFFKIFIVCCSRDGLTRDKSDQRNKILPRNISFHIIHFLYAMLDNQMEGEYYQIIQESILKMIGFIGMVITTMNEKLGNPNTLQQVLTLSQIVRQVQQYNYFSLEILSDVISMSQIKIFPNLPRQRLLDIIHHKNIKHHFKKTPSSLIDIKQVTDNHRSNIAKVHKQITTKMNKVYSVDTVVVKGMYSLEEFEESVVIFLKMENLHYRQTMKIWRKIWKRLRLLHYYWSVGMDQRQTITYQYIRQQPIYKHKFSKITDKYGMRSILTVQPNQPWHVRKMQMDQQTRYRSSNFLFNLYKNYETTSKKPKTFLEKIFSKNNQDQQYNVEWIKHNSKRKGTLKLSCQKLMQNLFNIFRFIYDSTFQKDSHLDFTSFTLAEYKPIKKQWQLVSIVAIYKRRYLVATNCLLIQFEDSTSLIFNFFLQNLDDFIKVIQAKQQSKMDKMALLKLNKIKFYTEKWTGLPLVDPIVENWRNNKITTMEYLMLLNKFAGRSYLDPVHYPVFPWIISNYQCKELMYRDLHLTLGSLGNEGRREMDPFSTVPAYHYGTHYSSPGVVFNFLVRLTPYTEAAKTLQGGRFDLSDRLFSSLKWCWHSVNSQVSDVRELIPQFYYLPQFLINIQNYDFGITQQGERVHNVHLPIWGPNAYQFITVHRKALQNQHINKNIQHWIDLIFGYKQKGKIAEQNLNLYYYLTYENAIDLSSVEDEVQKMSIQSQIIHFGQTPTQLFTKQHPSKMKTPSKQIFPYKKLRFIGSLQTTSSIIILFKKGEKLFIFKDSVVLSILYKSQFKVDMGLTFLRSSSKDNVFHVEDVNCNNRVVVFGNQKFIAIGAYVNGDLLIYSLSSGAKLEEVKGSIKNCIFVNSQQNLLLCGCENGLLEVFEIVYTQNDSLKLVEIASEYYLFPIQHISEGGGFIVVSSGNLSVVNKITRSMSYVHDKKKRKGCTMMRSIESKRKILGSFIVSNPLFCLVFYNSLQVYVYSINGQRLFTKQIQILLPPIIIKDQSLFEYILVLLEKSIAIYRLPDLEVVKSIAVPSKEYIDMKVTDKNIFLISNMGQILYFTDDE